MCSNIVALRVSFECDFSPIFPTSALRPAFLIFTLVPDDTIFRADVVVKTPTGNPRGSCTAIFLVAIGNFRHPLRDRSN